MHAHPNIADGFIVMLPRVEGEALPWWRFEGDALVESGVDVDPGAASSFDFARPGQNLVAILPAGISRAEWFEPPEGLSDKQAEALIARRMAEHAIGGAATNHAVARLDGEDAPVLSVVTAKSYLARALAMLADMGIDPTHVVPAICVARHAAATGEAGAAVVPVGGEVIFVADRLAMPADPALEKLLAPEVEPAQISDATVEASLRAILADPPLNMLVGAFARRRRLPKLQAGEWRTLAILCAAIVVSTLLIGLVTLWRYSEAADDADARALTAIEAVLGEQPDLATGEAALDDRLAKAGQGAAAFSVPLSALYQALQPVPQVSVQQLGYLGNGTLSASLSAPDAAPVNQLLASLQQSGYRVTANSRVDQSGAAVFDVTVRGY